MSLGGGWVGSRTWSEMRRTQDQVSDLPQRQVLDLMVVAPELEAKAT